MKKKTIKAVKIKQIWGVEYMGEFHYTCVTEDGQMLRHKHNPKTKEDYWEVVVVPIYQLKDK